MLIYPIHVLATNRVVDTMISRSIDNEKLYGDGKNRKFRMLHDLKNIRNISGLFIGFLPYSLAYFKGMEWTFYKKVDDLFLLQPKSPSLLVRFTDLFLPKARMSNEIN